MSGHSIDRKRRHADIVIFPGRMPRRRAFVAAHRAAAGAAKNVGKSTMVRIPTAAFGRQQTLHDGGSVGLTLLGHPPGSAKLERIGTRNDQRELKLARRRPAAKSRKTRIFEGSAPRPA